VVSTEPELTGALLEGRYRVEELLAVGGMSKVYRGTDTRLDRAVAIKVMDPRLAADPAFRNRFEREARAIASIDHPNVVDVYDQGEHGGPPDPLVFLVMELVPGGNLRDVLHQRGALPVDEAFAVLEPVLSGLASAHAKGLAHRDVKPENVLISRGGAVKVADFGLVTAAAKAGASTTGMIIGTVAYLSPEQVTGRGSDARSDVYAAGVLLYELLTGVPPYRGEHALSVAYQHVNKDVPAPSELVPDLPPDVDALVATATRREPDARPPDAETLLHAVLGVRAALGIPRVAVPVPDTEQVTVSMQTTAPTNGPRPTRALTSVAELNRSPTSAPDGDEPSDHLIRRRKSRQLMAAWIGGVALLGLLVAAIAWGAGISHWTTVPTVVGMDQTTAGRAVQAAGLVPSVQQRHDNTIPAGTVTSSTPVADAAVAKGSTVLLVVSSGRPVVPTITPGTSVAQAEEILRNSDLTVASGGDTRHSHPNAPPGSVIGTSPSAGTAMDVGAPVTLVVSSGPAPRRHYDDNGDKGPASSIFDQIQQELRHALGG
jgi:eukaryotic-like serine/threonine-protein kinase